MNLISSQLFSKADGAIEEGLNQRLAKQNVIASNITNANTPGYRALGYAFEKQLQDALGNSSALALRVTNGKHVMASGQSADGNVKPDLHVKPTESVGNDGNTVDVDAEMADLAETQVMYKASVEILNRKFAMMRYGINGGR
jgi:flagellar basal-body rod protein FlgB